MVENQGPPSNRAGNEPGKTLPAAVSASAEARYHGVPGGKHGILPRYVGAGERGRSNPGEEPQPSRPTSKRKSLTKCKHSQQARDTGKVNWTVSPD